MKSKQALAVLAVVLGCSSSLAEASIEFNGSSSYTVINDSFLNGVTTSTFTFDFWIKPLDVNRFQNVWGKTEFWKEWGFGGLEQGNFGFMAAWPNSYYGASVSANTLKANRWQHIVIVGNGTDCRFYLDGLPIPATGSLYGQLSFNASPSGSARGGMVWGLRDNTTLPDDGWFRGFLSYFRVWDRALSAAEVSQYHQNPPADSAPGLRHHIPFNEISGSTFRDVIGGIQGNAYDTTWSSDNPQFGPPVPHPATATAQVVNGFVVGLTITDPGYGYTNAPAVVIDGGGGRGATAVATVVNGLVTGLTITSAGIGYTSAPQVIIASPPFMPWLEMMVRQVEVTQHVVLGRNYVLEASTNLVNWTQVGDQFKATAEIITQTFDVKATGRYFRLQEVP